MRQPLTVEDSIHQAARQVLACSQQANRAAEDAGLGVTAIHPSIVAAVAIVAALDRLADAFTRPIGVSLESAEIPEFEPAPREPVVLRDTPTGRQSWCRTCGGNRPTYRAGANASVPVGSICCAQCQAVVE